MSGIGEIVGIIACVAGVISAYRDGGAIIQKIKVKRAAKRAPPPPRLLEDSIDQAPGAIEVEKQRGIQRFGPRFEEGDHICVIALQQVTIQLQGSLLEKLRNAAFDDEVKDFNSLVDAADLGRDRTIGALLEFRQRLLQAAPIVEVQAQPQPAPRHALDSQVPHAQAREPAARPSLPIRSSNEPAPTPTPLRVAKTWTREYGASKEASGEEDAASGAEDPHQTSHRKRHGSLFGFFKHHRSHSGSNDQPPKALLEEGRGHTSTSPTSTPLKPSKSPTSVPFQPPRQCDASERRTSTQQQQQDPKFTYHEWEDDPAAIWGSKPPEQSERRDTVTSSTISAVTPDGPSSPGSTTRSPPSSTAGPVSRSTTHLSSPGAPAGSIIAHPTPENDYLGFCKSAWKLQMGDRKAMQKCKEFNDGWSQSTVYHLACAHSKCAFAGHIALDKIWTKVWVVEAKGIKFRWPFLAKSHVPQSKVKDHQYAYQCIFCVFRGEKSPVYFGTDTLLEHLRGHRGQALGEVVLYKTKCVADRVAEDEEEFDVNLWPLTVREQGDRKQSEVLSDDLLGLGGGMGGHRGSNDAQDSMFSANEPWNKGLSDFHYGGEFGAAELE